MRKPWLSFALLAAALLLASPALHAQTYGVTGSKVGYPDQCTNDATNPTSAEWLTCTQKRAGTTKTNPLYVEPAAGVMPVGNYVWDGAAWQKWRAYLLNQDNLAAASLGAASGSFLLGYDTAGGNWDRVRLAPLAATTAPTTLGLQVQSAEYFYNGTNFVRWTGPTLGADNVANATPAPWTNNFNYAYDGATWDRVRTYTLSDALGSAPTAVGATAFNTFYDGTNFRRWQGESWDTGIDTVTIAPSVIGLNAFYEGGSSKGYRWTGELWDTDMGFVTNPNVNSFGVFRDSTTNKNAQVQGEAWDADMAVVNAPSSLALNVFRDSTGSKNTWWYGAVPADNLGTAMAAPYTLSLGTFYDGTNYRRWTGETYDSALATTVAPVTIALNAFYDGGASTSQYWLGGSLTSSISAPVDGPYVGSIMYGYSATGPFYYPVKADANGIFVHQADLLPGEDSTNDWRKVRIQSVATYAPTKTTTATVTAAETEVLASVEVLGYAGYTINVKNTGGVNSLDTTYLYVSPDGTNWVLLDTNVTNVAPGITLRAFAFSNSTDRYVKVMAAATAAVTTSADCWITARVAN